MSETSQPYLGIISGERRRSHADVAERASRIAGGLHRLGVRQGSSVCILMRNDIAFIEAAYAAMQLGRDQLRLERLRHLGAARSR